MITPGIQAQTEFGQLVRAARERSGPDGRRLTQVELGARVGVKQVKIARIEAGRTPVTEELADRLVAELVVTTEQEMELRTAWLMAAIDDQDGSGPRQVPGYAMDLMRFERVAVEVLCWHELRIPGPIQSDRYMRSQFDSAGRADVTPATAVRRQRRDLFASKHLQRYQCLLYEEALHRAARDHGPEIARDQIDLLIAMIEGTSDDPRVDQRTSIQLVPRDAVLPDLRGDATVLLFTQPHRGVVYIEHFVGGSYLKKEADVETAVDRWHRLVPYALDAIGSAELLRSLRRSLPAEAVPTR